MPEDQAPVPVLYIAGAGRSGSTILDISLGNHPDVIGVGELINLSQKGYIADQYCACGERANRCPFWSEVRREWLRRTGDVSVRVYTGLQRRFEHFRRWPRLWLETRRRSPEFVAYATRTRALYQTIQAVSGKRLIVDSSKEPVRAYALTMVPGIDVRIIHLVRDGRGVTYSLKKVFRRDERAGLPRDFHEEPTWRTAAFWVFVNLQAEWLLRRLPHGHFQRILYEEFVADPLHTYERVSRLMGLDLRDLAQRVARGDALHVFHTIAGNRLRMDPAVRLNPDRDWPWRLSRVDRWQFWLLAGWLMKRYGYRREGSISVPIVPPTSRNVSSEVGVSRKTR